MTIYYPNINWEAESSGRKISVQRDGNITGMMAGGFLAAVPPVLITLVFQRYIVNGMTTGSIKG